MPVNGCTRHLAFLDDLGSIPLPNTAAVPTVDSSLEKAGTASSTSPRHGMTLPGAQKENEPGMGEKVHPRSETGGWTQ
jgi:hypothetical protein